MIKNVIFGV